MMRTNVCVQNESLLCVGTVLAKASARIAHTLELDKAVARLEAQVLAAHAWQVSRAWLIAHDTDTLPTLHAAQFHALLERRLTGEPVAYITGEREFYGRRLKLTPAVLIPRPETELLIEVALAHIPENQTVDILDLGTGSGCIAISLALERPSARVTAVDLHPEALAVARANAQHWGAQIKFIPSDWFSALVGQKFDWIVSNPPYVASDDLHLASGDVRFEPRSALRSDKQGTRDIELIVQQSPHFLQNGGGLLVEHGYDQAARCASLLQTHGFTRIQTWQDLSRIDRLTAGFLSE